ncbi:DUF4148 domain-containing protein [Paraburkholderia xenovorans]|uniref:DUF4148 domain-containing protein n=1 Tax=Paraburkholderia xenovorans TaxID=36873 RepID=UPI0038B8FB6F
MKLVTKTLASALLLIGSASAMAAPGLTQQQCHDYPFVRTKGEVTHKQLMQELGELEAAGYSPDDSNTYPDDLQTAEQKVQAEYRADCLQPAVPTSAQASSQPAG